MPKQSRGFFTCDFCGLALDTLEEASEHEQTQCPKRPLQPANLRELPPPGTRPYRYGELGNIYYGAVSTPHFAPTFRVVPLMGQHDRGTSVAKDDIPAVKSLELFEAPPEIAAMLHDTGGPSVTSRQVGLRCSFCATSEPNENNTTFPATLASIASSVREMAERHLSRCKSAPAEIREACGEAIKNRQQNTREENEQSGMDLLDYCMGLCHHLAIVNKHPHRMGVAFADTEGLLLPYTSAETPSALRGPPSGAVYSFVDRPGPPMSHDHRSGFSNMARPMPIMGSHIMGPGDAIAPTPLQRRRDRPDSSDDRGPYPNSADRDYAVPTPAGYPTPYSQGRSGSDGQYEQEIQTPAQPNFEGKRQTPTSSRPSESSSPAEEYPPFELPPNFPFFQETDRTWHCKFCCHVHPSYRDPHAIWQSSGGVPPPGSFIESHLSMCRAYHQSSMPPPMYQGPPPPYGAPWMAAGYPPPPGWDGHSPPHAGGSPPSHHNPGLFPRPQPGPRDLQYPYPPSIPHDEYQASRNAVPPRDPKRHLVVPQLTDHRSGEPPHPNARSSVAYLSARENEHIVRNPAAKKDCLVLEEDRLLLTDYFYHLMLQLQVCRFSESDRKTRGGKRETIALGYGGLQCIHCADVGNSRKFFWSNVDRLANSFAEIPGHVLKCRRCPEATKSALMNLKRYHPEQMARLPRGSQKVFFRRMWRRLHDDDDEIGAAMMAAREDQENDDGANKDDSPNSAAIPRKPTTQSSTSHETQGGSDDDGSAAQRSTLEAAMILAEYSRNPVPASESSRVLLSISNDKEWISDMDCYIRKQLEFFCATEVDVDTALEHDKSSIVVGQVGIRCLHCAMACKGDEGCSGMAVSYPSQLNSIHEAVREFQRLHLDSCVHIPDAVKDKVSSFKGASSLSSVLRKYYVLAAKALGLFDTPTGVWAGGDCVPIGAELACLPSLAESELPSTEGGSSPVSATDDNKRHESPNGALGEPVAKKTKGGIIGHASKVSDSEADTKANEETENAEPGESTTTKRDELQTRV